MTRLSNLYCMILRWVNFQRKSGSILLDNQHGSPMRPERDIVATDIADMQMPEMKAIAAAHRAHPAEIALKWAVQRGQIPIPFSTNEAHCASNLGAVLSDPLTDEEMAVIATLERNNRLVKGQVFLWEGAKDWHDLWDEDGTITKGL